MRRLAWRRQGPLLLQAQSALGEVGAGHGFQTGLHEARAHLVVGGHLHDGMRARLLADLLLQPQRRPSTSATGGIAFGEGFVAVQAPEAPFVEHEFNAMASQRHISFDPEAHIMLFDAHWA